MSAGIARKIRRNYPCTYPAGWDHSMNPLWPQWLPESKRYIYHLVTKQKFYQKPTYGTSRASLERMRSHAEHHRVRKISHVSDLVSTSSNGSKYANWFRKFFVLPCSNYRFFKASVDPTENDCNSDFNDNALAQAQETDESLHQVRKWIRSKRVPKNHELQVLPRLGWQMFNQLSSLHIKNNVLCRKFEPLDGRLPFLQRIVPHSMVPEILTALHSSKTAGHLGTHKVIEKVRQRFYWPDFKEDVKQFIQCCDVCQKKSGPPKTHRHSLVDWKISYPFHHIGLDFLGPHPLSNGNRFILVIGDHFTKWYEAIPLPDQQASTTADALLEHWICRFGWPNSIHTDQGRNFESALFQRLMTLLEINKTRTTSFHPQSNSVIERMNRTLLIMLTKSIDKQQANWSYSHPFVLMAYWSSVHESTGFTPNRLVLGHEVLLPLDLMYPPPESHVPANINEHVMTQQRKFHQVFELVRRNTTAQQRRCNALYNRKVHGPTYRANEFVLLHYDVTVTGQSPKLSSPWRGPYRILQCINDVNYKIEELSTGKQQIVRYDRLKRYHGTPPPSIPIPTRQSAPGPAPQTTPHPSSKTVNHDDCVVSFLPPPNLFARSPWFSHTLPTPTDTTPPRNVTVDSHVSPPISPSITASRLPYDLTPSSLPSQTSPPCHSTTPSNPPRTLPFANSTPTRSPSSPVETIVRRAARELHSRSPSNKRTLRPSTVTQRKAQPIFSALAYPAIRRISFLLGGWQQQSLLLCLTSTNTLSQPIHQSRMIVWSSLHLGDTPAIWRQQPRSFFFPLYSSFSTSLLRYSSQHIWAIHWTTLFSRKVLLLSFNFKPWYRKVRVRFVCSHRSQGSLILTWPTRIRSSNNEDTPIPQQAWPRLNCATPQTWNNYMVTRLIDSKKNWKYWKTKFMLHRRINKI